MTTTDLIKGLIGIRFIIEQNKDDLPEQTKVQLEVIDETIEILKEQL